LSSGDRFGIPAKQSGFESSANVLLRILSFHDLGRAPELCKGPAKAGIHVWVDTGLRRYDNERISPKVVRFFGHRNIDGAGGWALISLIRRRIFALRSVAWPRSRLPGC